MSQCTCITDKEITCIVHPTEQSLKRRIAELEEDNKKAHAMIHWKTLEVEKWKRQDSVLIHAGCRWTEKELKAENQRLREALRLAASSEELAAYSKILGYDLAELLEGKGLSDESEM